MAEMADALAPAEWRARYAQGPDDLEASLAGLTEETIDSAAAAGEWTIREIVNHVAEVEVRATFWMTIAIGNSGTDVDCNWFPGTNRVWGRRSVSTSGQSRPRSRSSVTFAHTC